ncbi:hypothetical protein M413DRAFT_30148 [Hebeloma cylindrosporum]|uniref:Uncharacterized protein n=1 Tax=Hebeloma cylindrosporum TaxID=76867 RepID=A0A0C2XKK6_HEBCY|nr:hypothetical protein M413DRAFT_30148 [Hebeloma cylindrosporum h7]
MPVVTVGATAPALKAYWIVMGNPGVFPANPHSYPWKPASVTRGMGFSSEERGLCYGVKSTNASRSMCEGRLLGYAQNRYQELLVS